jgi:thioredoxin-dependent peroxiredoxin
MQAMSQSHSVIQNAIVYIEARMHDLDALQEEIQNELGKIQAQKTAYALRRQQLLSCFITSCVVNPPPISSFLALPVTEYACPPMIPAVTFKARVRDPSIGGENPFAWKDVTTADLFKNKRCVLFALPGAFTPTCSSAHLPEYQKLYEEIKACGIDEVYCLSVNDAFVMRQWGLKLGLVEEEKDASNPLNPGNFSKVKLIPDGACLFTRGMGMSCSWVSERGFGERSWRYSAVIKNGMVERIFIEVLIISCLCVMLLFDYMFTFVFGRMEASCRTVDQILSGSPMPAQCLNTYRDVHWADDFEGC